MTKNNILLGTLQVLVAACLWGASGVAGALLTQRTFSGLEVTCVRLVGASIVLLILFPVFRKPLKILKQNPQRIPFLCLQSVLGILMMSLCYLTAVGLIGVSLAISLLYTSPIWTLIFGRIILGEHISKARALLAIVVVAGIGIMISGSEKINLLGVILALGSGISYALYGVMGKKALTGLPSTLVFFTSIVFSGLLLAFFPSAHSAANKLFSSTDQIVWFASLFIVFLGTLIPFFLFMKGLEKMTSATASVFTTVEPVAGIILATLIIHEQLDLNQYLGIFIIIAAAFTNAIIMKTQSNTIKSPLKDAFNRP